MVRAAQLAVALGLLALAPAPGAADSPPPAAFEQALAPRIFSFPADHGPHPGFRQEWWYFAGHLAGENGERFGFELTFFRFALAPPVTQEALARASAWRAGEIYMAHFAVSDLGAQRFQFAQKLARGALELAAARAGPIVWVDDWSLRALPQSGEGVRWELRAAQPGYALRIELRGERAPVLNGAAGLSQKSAAPGAASYYYSLPRLEVHGELTRAGRVLHVAGLAWCDREWGSGTLGARQQGWDWYALQLDDGSALMFYALREGSGAPGPYSAGTFIDPGGAAHALAARQVQIEVTAHWRNRFGDTYPAGWHLQVPTLALDVRLEPQLPDQELRTTPTYWEGAVAVSGQRAAVPVSGSGYVELTGYAQERRRAPPTGMDARLVR